MRTSKDIEWTKVTGYTYAVDEYLKDIPIYDVVSNYVSLYKINKYIYRGEFEINSIPFSVDLNIKTNTCLVNGEEYNAEQFVILFEGEGKETEIIKKITGIDLDDYISDVTYNDGTIEYLDVKGKTFFQGGWRKIAK